MLLQSQPKVRSDPETSLISPLKRVSGAPDRFAVTQEVQRQRKCRCFPDTQKRRLTIKQSEWRFGCRSAQQQVFHDARHPSAIILPVRHSA
jgi:hypothetical protein